jgi:predicted negative regulator of RcsB-dependent stress response
MGAIDNWLGWDKLSWTRKILIAIPIVAAVIGWQYYTKNQEAAETKTKMLAMCEGEQKCIAAVEQYEDTCFKDHYHMGRRSQGVKMEEFVACVNQHAGEELFVAVPKQ